MAKKFTKSDKNLAKRLLESSYFKRSQKPGRKTRETASGTSWKDQTWEEKRPYLRFKSRLRYSGMTDAEKLARLTKSQEYRKMSAEEKAERNTARKNRPKKGRKKYKYADLSKATKEAKKRWNREYYNRYKQKFSESAKARRAAKREALAKEQGPMIEITTLRIMNTSSDFNVINHEAT